MGKGELCAGKLPLGVTCPCAGWGELLTAFSCGSLAQVPDLGQSPAHSAGVEKGIPGFKCPSQGLAAPWDVPKEGVW